jgi:hypothetical protein
MIELRVHENLRDYAGVRSLIANRFSLLSPHNQLPPSSLPCEGRASPLIARSIEIRFRERKGIFD